MTVKEGYESYNTPKTNGASSGPYSDRGYTMDEAVLVDKAKRTHQETTESAQRAAKVSRNFAHCDKQILQKSRSYDHGLPDFCGRLQTAEQTREIAANTLDALHQQGQKLEVVERDLYEVCAVASDCWWLYAQAVRCIR